MTQRDKLIQRLKDLQFVAFQDIHNLLIHLGFTCRIRGSHHNYIKGDIRFTLPAHGKDLKKVYIVTVAEALKKDGH
jgi:predicted RNA binding protein YcfA (HicA-like mRNA interferase family)